MQTKIVMLFLILTFFIALTNHTNAETTEFSFTILIGNSVEPQNIEELSNEIDFSLTESPILEMPEEYLNYTVIQRSGVPYAVIDGFYPMFCKNAEKMGPIMMVYPTPPDTENITISFNGTSLKWSNFTEKYPEALHHTVLGEWSMIETSFTPSKYFTLTIHYEHPLSKNEEEYQFLYDLNISPYLSASSLRSTAYFRVDLPNSFYTNMKIFTVPNDNTRNHHNFETVDKNDHSLVSFNVTSIYPDQIPGDILITFQIREKQIFPIVAITIIILTVLINGLILVLKKNKDG